MSTRGISSRLKAQVTRTVHGGLQPDRKGIRRSPDRDSLLSPATPEPKLKPYRGRYRFLGSFKYGGKVQRTGLYLVHKGEHIRSPFTKGRSR